MQGTSELIYVVTRSRSTVFSNVACLCKMVDIPVLLSVLIARQN